VIVYDLDKLSVGPMEKTYDLPGGEWRRIRKAYGYSAIVVNGAVTMRDGLATGETPGRLLRHGQGA
jgi:N-acyl-D-amino-acid deacylase